MFLWREISLEARSCGFNENEELKKVSSAKDGMLEDVEASRPYMKRMKSTGDVTEPCVIPALIDCRLERKPSPLIAINESEAKLPVHLIRALWRPNIGSSAR